jgi:hypothetical protein
MIICVNEIFPFQDKESILSSFWFVYFFYFLVNHPHLKNRSSFKLRFVNTNINHDLNFSSIMNEDKLSL